jgi:hypothetical protein
MSDSAGRRRPSPALVISIVALVVSLGGVAFAATKITSKNVVDNSLKSIDLKNGKGVKGVDVVANSLTGAAISESSLGKVPSAAQADSAANSDKLDGIDSAGFIQGAGDALVARGSVDLSGVFDPNHAGTSLGSIPGLGSFSVGGGFISPGSDCAITFTNTSGAAVVVNGAAPPGLADGATVELAGVENRPDADDATFTILTQGADKAVLGQVTVAFGFPGGDTVCAGAISGLLSG